MYVSLRPQVVREAWDGHKFYKQAWWKTVLFLQDFIHVNKRIHSLTGGYRVDKALALQ